MSENVFHPVPKPPKRVKDKKAREKARKKYCEYCGVHSVSNITLEVHHIRGQGRYGKGDVAENLITLCKGPLPANDCHGKAQTFEISIEALEEIKKG